MNLNDEVYIYDLSTALNARREYLSFRLLA